MNYAAYCRLTLPILRAHAQRNFCAAPVSEQFSVLQANFAGDAQYKQHLEGPIHRKALAKAEAERQRNLQLGANKGAAESALVRAPTISHHVMTLCIITGCSVWDPVLLGTLTVI